MQVIALEVFDLHSMAGVEDCKPLLEMGARLGGKAALTINYSNADRGESAEILAKFAEVAAGCGLATNLEPVAGGKSQTLAEAEDLIRRSGADVGICLDPHHLFRAGGTVADIARVEPGRIRYVQLCDGPIPQPVEIAMTEAVCERLYPGDGDFALLDYLRAAPHERHVAAQRGDAKHATSCGEKAITIAAGAGMEYLDLGVSGRGIEAATTPALGADIYAYSNTRGIFGGISLAGSVVQPRDDWNQNYYGRPATAREIVHRVI